MNQDTPRPLKPDTKVHMSEAGAEDGHVGSPPVDKILASAERDSSRVLFPGSFPEIIATPGGMPIVGNFGDMNMQDDPGSEGDFATAPEAGDDDEPLTGPADTNEEPVPTATMIAPPPPPMHHAVPLPVSSQTMDDTSRRSKTRRVVHPPPPVMQAKVNDAAKGWLSKVKVRHLLLAPLFYTPPALWHLLVSLVQVAKVLIWLLVVFAVVDLLHPDDLRMQYENWAKSQLVAHSQDILQHYGSKSAVETTGSDEDSDRLTQKEADIAALKSQLQEKQRQVQNMTHLLHSKEQEIASLRARQSSTPVTSREGNLEALYQAIRDKRITLHQGLSQGLTAWVQAQDSHPIFAAAFAAYNVGGKQALTPGYWVRPVKVGEVTYVLFFPSRLIGGDRFFLLKDVATIEFDSVPLIQFSSRFPGIPLPPDQR